MLLLVILTAIILFFAAIGAFGLLACGLGSLGGVDPALDRRYARWGITGGGVVLVPLLVAAVFGPHEVPTSLSAIIPAIVLLSLFAAGIAMYVLYLWEQYCS